MKAALIAAIVAAVVASASAGAALTTPHLQVKRVVGVTTTIPAGGPGFAWASCPGTLKAVGGGMVGEPFESVPVHLDGSYPLSGVKTWEITVSNPNDVPATVRAVVTCVG